MGCYSKSSDWGHLSRLTAVALIAGSAAACSADSGRFTDPNANPFAGNNPGPAYTGSVAAAAPSSAVQRAPLAGPQGGYPAPSYPSGYQTSAAPAPAPAPYQTASLGPTPAPYAPANAYPAPAAPSYPAVAQPRPVPQAQPSFAARPQPVAPAAMAAAAPPVRQAVSSAAGPSHTVAPGETLSSVARMYGVSRSAVAAANGLQPESSLIIGQRIVIPGAGAANVAAHAPAAAAHPAQLAALPPVAPAALKPAPVAKPAPVVAAAPVPAAQPAKVAAAPQPAETKVETIAAVQPAAPVDDVRDANDGLQFRWPVRGRVISGFGPKPGGQQNEGINVSVPEGTAVKAAEDGVVAYAGNELKGYGNLVLIKHANGYVTAYAHNSEIDVKKGQTVKRGQVIAKAGQTGSVTTPQVHFEIRKGSQPVDPSQHLAGL